MNDWLERNHREFVEKYIRTTIKDPRVINAFLKVRRYLFVPEKYRNECFVDAPLPIGEGQTISQPSLVAIMVEKLQLKRSDKVLEIGTGSGFQTALLAQLAKRVCSVERIKSLAERAKAVLKKLKVDNVTVIVGDGSKGLPEKQPFDAIIVSAAADCIPPELMDQLAEGGRLVIPVREPVFGQMLKVGVKRNGVVAFENIEPVSFVPLIRGS